MNNEMSKLTPTSIDTLKIDNSEETVHLLMEFKDGDKKLLSMSREEIADLIESLELAKNN